jgi:hypothetical protein
MKLASLAAAMAIALATAAPAQAGMQLSKILPFPGVVPGGQNAQVNAEWVVVKNTASRAKNLRGWFIREKKRPCHRAPGVGPRAGQVRLPGRDRRAAASDPGQGLRLLRGPAQAAGSGGLTWSTSRSIVAPSG